MNSPVQASHSLRVFLAVVITVVVLRYAQDVFVPLALAILMTFLLAPLVERLQRLAREPGAGGDPFRRLHHADPRRACCTWCSTSSRT